MKQSIYLLRIFLLASLALTGCQQEVITELSDSGLLLSLSDNQLEVTRSTPAELGKPLATQFNVKIEKNDGQVIYDDTFTEKPIPASAGRYTLTATCGENPVLAWDAPYYKGTATAEVGKGLAKVTIPCTVANALLSISFVNQGVFDQMYSTYGVKVENGNLSLLITAELSTQSTYFQAGSTPKVTFEGTLKDGGQTVSLDLTENLKAHLPLQAGDHAKIALRASNTTMKVEKVEVVKETIQETIPSDWLPKPKVNGFADGATTLHYVETNDAIPAAIEFTAPTPIQDAEFTLNLEDEHLKQLNGTYTLSTLTEDQRTLLINSGITLPALQTQKGALDLTQLTANLQTNAGVTTHNKVSLRIKSNDRWSAEQGTATEYVIETVKPEFTVSVQPGNIWTKEFTVDEIEVTSGNAAKIKKQLVYQYSANNGTSWETFTNLRKTELTPETNYSVRTVFRECIISNQVNVKTHHRNNIAGGNMESWTYTDGPKKWYGGPFWKRWYARNEKNESAEGWCTRNGYTTHEGNVSAYQSNSGTERTDKCNSGSYAAEIKTIGWGSGTTAASPISIIKQNTAGELFLGTIDGNNNPTYGIAYDSRPTGVEFYYQYQPKGNHKFKVEITLFNGNDIIASNLFEGTQTNGAYVKQILNFNYDIAKIDIKVTHLSIKFNSGENTNGEVDTASVNNGSRHTGNVLYIDDISLIYDK